MTDSLAGNSQKIQAIIFDCFGVLSGAEPNGPNEELFELIRNLKPKYKIGMLSNAGRDMLPELFSDEQIALFDATALSFETGLLKPRHDAYLDAAGRLDLEPGACIFVDDQEGYCTAARETGMQAIWYRDFEQMRRELEMLLEK